MPFEAFLTQESSRPKKWQRITLLTSLGIHGAAVIVGLVYSFWHVEELSPPTVTVTFMSAPPPPPPPPPKRKKSNTPVKPKVPTEVVQPRPNEIVQPKETPKEEPKVEEEPDDGVEGGVEGGVPGGVVAAAAPVAAEPPKSLPPQVAAQQRISTNEPEVPAVLAKAGMNIFNLVRICVTVTGEIADVKLIKPSDPLWDKSVMDTARGWKFRPAMIEGRAVPFCSNFRFNMKVTP